MQQIRLKDFNVARENEEAYRTYRNRDSMYIVEEKIYSLNAVKDNRYIMGKLNDAEQAHIVESLLSNENNIWVMSSREIYNEYTGTASKEYVELIELVD